MTVHKLINNLITFNHFNSHAHVERDSSVKNDNYGTMDFNSHAHVERDMQKWQRIVIFTWISTHTLTWSVTIMK